MGRISEEYMGTTPDTLQEKLRDIQLNPIEKYEEGDYYLSDTDIAQIQAAFQEAGYIKAHTLPKGIYNATGHSLTQIAAGDTMTGQEFYDRFKAEYHNKADWIAADETMGDDAEHDVLLCARLAAGVSEAPPKLSDGTLYPWLKKKVDEEKSRGVSDE